MLFMRRIGAEEGKHAKRTERQPINIFCESGSLLILGDLGVGKTIALLRIAERLLGRAIADSDHPIPVVLNLVSWSSATLKRRDRSSLEDWLTQELKSSYRVPPKVTKQWLKAQHLILLLDGLDEIKAQYQNDCIPRCCDLGRGWSRLWAMGSIAALLDRSRFWNSTRTHNDGTLRNSAFQLAVDFVLVKLCALESSRISSLRLRSRIHAKSGGWIQSTDRYKITLLVIKSRVKCFSFNSAIVLKRCGMSSQVMNSALHTRGYSVSLLSRRFLIRTQRFALFGGSDLTCEHCCTLTKTENGSTTTYVWNDKKRLIAATVTDANGAVGQQLQYRYNDDGIRVSSSVNGQETRYLLDEVQPYAQVLEEYAPNGTVAVSYVYGNDLISQTQGGQTTYYHVDGLGSTTELTDTAGNVVSSSRYDAFGNAISSASTIANKYLFTSEQFDSNLGDYYLRARYYAADSGRFTRQDDYEGRLGEPLTLHKYIYANANPANLTDPTGQFSWGEVIATTILLEILSQAFVPHAVQTPIQDGDTSDPLEPQRNLFELGVLASGIGVASFAGFRLVAQNGRQFLAYLGGEIGSDGGRYFSPVGAAVRGQFFPKGAWIERETFQSLEKEAGKASKKKFVAALKKSIEEGTVGPTNQQGIKVLTNSVNGYTHELKINGSAARILGKFDENGVLVFDEFLPKGLH